jgi:hypothetical protein
MNPGYRKVIAAGDEERRNLFLTAASRMGTAVQHVEKDFWVCWTLDVLFHGLGHDTPRLLFKGGTSLSKAFGLIPRFSEDIDITVFRSDLGHATSIEELEALSGKKRRARLDAIKATCQEFINGPLQDRFSAVVHDVLGSARLSSEHYKLELDPHDPDQQTLLFWYPAATQIAGDYVRSAVKIEAGARSALDPNVPATVEPYVAGDLGDIDLRVSGITTVKAERTFWDKVIILHGVRSWHERRGELRHGGQRVSRHYYDVFRLLHSPIGAETRTDRRLAVDCARHARMFFNSPDLDLEDAAPGTFALAPTPLMFDALRRDYAAMTGMIFGDIPPFDDVVAAVAEFEAHINAAPDSRDRSVP